MSFGIKVNNVFLELKPGLMAEVGRKSPFFAIGESTSEVSTPINLLYSAVNAAALGLPFHYYAQRRKIKVAAQLFDGNTFMTKATLVVETGNININRIEDTELTGYVLFGISDFYQLVKGKKLTDLYLGGPRKFIFTTQNPTDGSAGYWQHFHNTWTDDTIPYVMAPVRNEGYIGENSTVEWLNQLGNDGKLKFDFLNAIVPFIRLPYLLTQIFKEHGFSVDFSGISDTQWQKLILLNLNRLDWGTPFPTVGPGGTIIYTGTPGADLTINLKNHVPDLSISDFIVQLFGRYGWAPVFDIMKRSVRMVAVKELGNGAKKDWTEFAEPMFKTSFNEDDKIFEFKNQIDSNDSYPSSPDFTNLKFLLPAYTIRFVTAPTAAMEGKLIFCYLENQWYQAKFDTTSATYKWEFFADNIYDDSPPNATAAINTTVSTLPVQLTKYRTVGNNDYYGVFPIMNQQYTKPIGFRTLIYHGMVWELNDGGSYGLIKYPYASSLRHDPLGTTLLTWSNVYRHKQFGGTVFEADYGIVNYWWKSFLKILTEGEEAEFKLHLPRHELQKFRWDDRILIANLLYLVKEITEPIPYTGYVVAKLKRVVREVIAARYTGPVAYARISAENIQTWTSQPIFSLIWWKADIRVSLFADQAGTIPFTPATPLVLNVNVTRFNNNQVQSVDQKTYTVTQPTQIIDTPLDYMITQNGVSLLSYTYTLAPSNNGEYEVI